MPVNLRTLVWLVLGRIWSRSRGVWSVAAHLWIYGTGRGSERCLASLVARVGRLKRPHTGSDGGMSQKASDFSCVPLCRICHTSGRNAYHRVRKEAFERRSGIDLARLVRALNIAHQAECEASAGGDLWQL